MRSTRVGVTVAREGVYIDVDGSAVTLPHPVHGPVNMSVGGVEFTLDISTDKAGNLNADGVASGSVEPAITDSKTIGDALEAWIASLRTARHATLEVGKKQREIERFASENGWSTLADITHETATAAASRIVSHFSTKTVQLRMSRLRVFLEFCVDAGWLAINPAAKVKLPKVVPGRGQRVLSGDEVSALLKHSPFPRKALYQFAAYTGLRLSELARLRWRHVVLKVEHPYLDLTGDMTKNGRSGQLPLMPPAYQAAMSVHSDTAGMDDAVWDIPVHRTIKRDMGKAGIVDANEYGQTASFHSLRKHLGTYLVRGGADPFVVKNMMRHQSIDTTNRIYVDARQIDLARKAATALGLFESSEDDVEKSTKTTPNGLTAGGGMPDSVCAPEAVQATPGRDTQVNGAGGNRTPVPSASLPDSLIDQGGPGPGQFPPGREDALEAEVAAVLADWLRERVRGRQQHGYGRDD